MMRRFVGQREGLIGVLEVDAVVAVLEEEVQLAEDLGDVAAVDLVDDQDVGLVRVLAGVAGDALQRAVNSAKDRLSVVLIAAGSPR